MPKENWLSNWNKINQIQFLSRKEFSKETLKMEI